MKHLITRRGLAARAPLKFVAPNPAGGAAGQTTRLVAHETILGTSLGVKAD